MLKKLRIKFIAIIMVMVTIVVVASFTTICLVEQQRANANLDAALNDTVDRTASWIVDTREKVAQTQAGEDTGQTDEYGNERGKKSKPVGPHIGGPDRNSKYPIAVYALDKPCMPLTRTASSSLSSIP